MLSVIAMLQTSFFKFSLTPYYSSSRNVPILLYESLEIITIMIKTFKMKSELQKAQKLNFSLFSKILTFCHFFRLRDVTFVRSFNLEKSYRRENPSG